MHFEVESAGLYPDIHVELSFLDRKVDLLNDGFDLVLRIGHLSDSNLVARRLGTSPRVIVASPGYLNSKGVPSSLSDLKARNCLVYTNLATINRWHFWHQGKEVSIPVRGSMQSNSSDAILACVLSDIGIAVMPNWLVQPLLDNGELIAIMDDYVPTEFPINAIYPHNNYIPLKVRFFVDFIKEIYENNPVLNKTT